MRFIPLAFVLVAAPAAAQSPPTMAGPCSVAVARAPDDVRQAIEHWVAEEPRCAATLEVRVIPTDGGYYLLARDPQGRTHERIVPDAETAGALVASWAAHPAPPQQTPFEVRQPAPSHARHESFNPPGSAPTLTVATAAPPRRASNWLSAAALVGMGDADPNGVRGEVDLKVWGAWALGVAASYAASNGEFYWGHTDIFDAKGLAYVSRTSQRGRWQLRGAVGAGVVRTRAVWSSAASPDLTPWETANTTGTFATGEASLVIARELGASWALAAGPLLSAYSHRASTQMDESGYVDPLSLHRTVDLAMYMGLRLRL